MGETTRDLAAGIAELRAGRADGLELARAALPGAVSLLVARLVRAGDGLAVELARRPIAADGAPGPPAGPGLLLGGEDLAVAGPLLDQAERAAADFAEVDAMEVLAHDERLAVTLAETPDGGRWLTLATLDGSGLAAVPVAGRGALREVLAEVERELRAVGLLGDAAAAAAVH